MGVAYTLDKIIIPVVEFGVDYKEKGFVQFRQHIDYDPGNRERFAYDVIFSLRNEVFGHNSWTGLALRCPNGHENNNYVVPSTEEINKVIETPVQPGFGIVLTLFGLAAVYLYRKTN